MPGWDIEWMSCLYEVVSCKLGLRNEMDKRISTKKNKKKKEHGNTGNK